MPEEDLVELKFRLYDGTDIGPFQYSPTSTVSVLKERIVADWPKVKASSLDYRFSSKRANRQHSKAKKNDSASVSCMFAYVPNKKIAPKTANDIKMINAGKILENSKTVGQCRAPFGELSKAIITMHVVVQPSLAKAKTEKKVDEIPRKHICSCAIM